MSWKVPGYRADALEGRQDGLETWRGIDEATGGEVVLRRVDGRADDVEDATWRSAAIDRIDRAGLVAPRQTLCDGEDLVVVYDVPHQRLASRGRSQGPAYVAALVGAVAGQLHALHAAGMTHGSVGRSTVRGRCGDPVLIGAVESALRDGGGDDTALDDVRSLASLGTGLLESADKRDADEVTRALSAILVATADAPPTGDDPCDPSLSAELARQCAPYADHAPATAMAAETRPDGPGGDYVSRHRRVPTRRWTRAGRRARARPQGRGRARSSPAGAVSGPATGIAVAAVMVAIAAWMGTVWGDGAHPQRSAPTAAAEQSPQTTDSRAADLPTRPGEFDAGSASPAQWVDYVGGLYKDRANAITNRTTKALEEVYVPASTQRDADQSAIELLAVSGDRIVGFAPKLVAVTDVSVAGHTATLSVIDQIPPYTVVDVAGAATTHAGREEQVVTLTMALVGGRWLIDTATRVP